MADGQPDIDVRAQLEELHPQAYGWAMSCCGWDVQMAEDVLQTSYLKVLDGRAVFGARSSFKTWFFEVVRRTAAGQRRRQALRKFLPLESMINRLPSESAGPERRLETSEKASRMIEALKVLPRRQREVLHLVFYADLTIREAAETLGISLGTARTHYERGKGRLREMLTEEMK